MSELHVAFGGGGIKSFLLENVLGALQARACRTEGARQMAPYFSISQVQAPFWTRPRWQGQLARKVNGMLPCTTRLPPLVPKKNRSNSF